MQHCCTNSYPKSSRMEDFAIIAGCPKGEAMGF